MHCYSHPSSAQCSLSPKHCKSDLYLPAFCSFADFYYSSQYVLFWCFLSAAKSSSRWKWRRQGWEMGLWVEDLLCKYEDLRSGLRTCIRVLHKCVSGTPKPGVWGMHRDAQVPRTCMKVLHKCVSGTTKPGAWGMLRDAQVPVGVTLVDQSSKNRKF